jgi:hypothetical protein
MTEEVEGPRAQGVFLEREVSRAIQQKGCPICRICAEHLEKQWFWFFSQSYAEGSDLGKYIGHWGFCKEHSTMIARIGPKWQKSAIYNWIIKAHLPKLEKLQRGLEEFARAGNIISRRTSRRSVRKLLREVVPTGDCLFCESSRRTARYYTAMLLKGLSDAEMRRLYEDSDGLCMQHFFLAVEDADFRHVRQLSELIKKQITGLRELVDDFEEFFRKGDYRFCDEPKGREQTAWIRAMGKIIGKADLGETSEIVES